MLDFIKKYKVYILAGFVVLFFFRSCGKSRSISKLEKIETANVEMIDSLQIVIEIQDDKLDSIPEILRIEKLGIYLSLDDTISRVDRTPQLMGFHTLIKDRIKDLHK
jgi:hypothetical protein